MQTSIIDMPNGEYRKILDHVSISELNVFADLPANYKHQFIDGNRRPASPSQSLGTDIHTRILEPGIWRNNYRVYIKPDGRTIAGKKYNEQVESDESAGLKYLTPTVYDQVERAAQALLTHPQVAQWSKSWIVERSMFWTDPDTGALCKGRTDAFISGDECAILDVKTTKSIKEFGASIPDYGYHRQAAYYMDGLAHASKGEIVPTKFYWLVVEPTGMCHAKVFQATDELIAFGRKQYKVLLQKFMRSKKSNVWPGYGTEIDQLCLPDWYKKQPQEMFKSGEDY